MNPSTTPQNTDSDLYQQHYLCVKFHQHQVVGYLHGNSELPGALRLAIQLRALPLGALYEVRVVTDLAQDVDASESCPVACKDGVHLLAVEVGTVHVPLVLAQLAEQHL